MASGRIARGLAASVLLVALTAPLAAARAPMRSHARPHPVSEAVDLSDPAPLAAAVVRGGMIWAYDQAAWVTTDEMIRRLGDPGAAGVSGWIVEPRRDGYRVTFYHLGDGAPRAVFLADERGGAITDSHRVAGGEDASLDAAGLRMIDAKRAAAQAILADSSRRPCTDGPFNSVVLPPDTPDGPIPVYFLTPQVKAGEFPFGGHYEYDVSPSGDIVGSRSFSRACLNMTGPSSGPAAAEAGQPAGAVVSDVLHPIPTEIHVWLALAMGQPIYVATPRTQSLWIVTGDRIDGPRPLKGPP